MRSLTAAMVAALFIFMSGMAAAQERIDPLASVNVGEMGGLGYDLVKLFPGGSGNPNDGELEMGILRHRVIHEGDTYLFVSADNAEAFEEDPDRYLPGAGGYCLLGLHRRAVDAQHNGNLLPPRGDPAARTFANGRWYFHGGRGAEKAFEKDADTIDARAAEAVAYFNDLLAKQVASDEVGPATTN